MKPGSSSQPKHHKEGTVAVMSRILGTPTRLFMAVNTTDADLDDESFEWDVPTAHDVPNPEGWDDYSLERWGEVRPFFFPSTKRVYRSRSAAQARADLIRRWGGTAEVIECTPQWQSVADANRERRKRKIHSRITKLEDALAAERTKYAEAASE